MTNYKNHKKLSESTVIVCGIVRNCGGNLKKNIRTIMRLCRLAEDYHVVIFENDSTDNSKQILQEWADTEKNIHISLNTFGTVTIPEKKDSVIPSFSIHRIEKMAKYRNYYLEYIEKENLPGDSVSVGDMDVHEIYRKGFIGSFKVPYEWDVLTANGISYAPSTLFRKRYYDAYAMVECGKEQISQTAESIEATQYKWAFLKKEMPLIRVASAFGGLAIYKRAAISGCRYGVMLNDDENVECRAEHFYFHRQMAANGCGGIFINPAMVVRYQTQVANTIRKIWKKFIK